MTTTPAHIDGRGRTRASVGPVKRTVVLVLFLAGVSRALLGCVDRCQMGDTRPQCNAYGAPDLHRDAGIAAPADAAVTD